MRWTFHTLPVKRMTDRVSTNGSAVLSRSGLLDDTTRDPRADNTARLFRLFAEFAREAGRDDLHDEFIQRAHSTAGNAPALANQPRHPEAERQEQLGCRLVREGKLTEAENAFREAIRRDPGHAGAHGNLGVALAQERKLPEAEAAFRLAIRLNPVNVTMYVNLATCLAQQGRPAEAEEWARQAIQLNPQLAEPHRLLGSALEARRRDEAAESAFREAARIEPGHAHGRYRLGRVLARRRTHQEAEAELREAVRLAPNLAPAWSSLRQLLCDTDRHAEAVEYARTTVRLEPNSAEYYNGLGVALAGCDKVTEAEAAYREAARLDPKNASVHSNLGNSLRSQGRLDEAEASLRAALQFQTDYAEAHNNLGIVLVQAGREDEAVKHYGEAIRIRSDYPEARMNRSLAYLANADFARGWPEYEWRFKVNRKYKPPPGPRWDGSPFPGKILLVSSEQGLGDSIHFCRYLTLAKARGGTVLFDCPEPLSALVATCSGVDRIVSRHKPGVTYDTHIPLLSLPGLFGVPPEAATAVVPYLAPDPARVEYWRKELASIAGLRVGIAWQGSPSHRGDKIRSVRLTRFAPLAAVPGVSLCSIQKGAGSEQLSDPTVAGLGAIDLGARTQSAMADVAALMMNLDLIVSVDTAVVHLAGALGWPVWVALPFAADWRWLRGRDDTPWYPTMKLFRPTTRGDWDGVFGRLAVALAGAARAKAEGRWNASPLEVKETGV
jgi:tetratricopeptide (TPR) repeat protein